MEFRVLGPLDVLGSAEPVRIGGPGPRAVLGILLANAGTAVPARRLAAQVSGDESVAGAAAAVKAHVAELRKVLGERVATVAAGHLLAVGPDEVDALRFAALVEEARRHLRTDPERAVAELTEALALWRGEPFGGVPDAPDVEAARRRLTELRLGALEDRLDAELTLGRHAGVLAELTELAAAHPDRDRLFGLYLLALCRCGRAAEARARYRARGGPSGAELAELAAAIEHGDPMLDRPAVVPGSARRFIGRRRELAQLVERLAGARLLTVTGTGGAGKSRLAREAAMAHRGAVHLVDLAALAPGGDAAEQVAAVLGVRPAVDEPLVDLLAARLRAGQSLLLLDNCQYAPNSAAKLVAELIEGPAGPRVLATGREPLDVPGEQVWPLGGLTVPGEGHPGVIAVRTDAVRLFADRGAVAWPEFTVHSENVGLVASLARRLDGLPLAIELIAAQLRVCDLDEVAGRLDRALLRAGPRPAARHILPAAIGCAHELLTPAEQTLFRRLSVFAGGLPEDAAEPVTGAPPGLAAGSVARLVEAALLDSEPAPAATRYRLPELVREYAAEALAESGEAEWTRHRHALWCATLAGTAEGFGGPGHAEVLRRLSSDEANLRTALDRTATVGRDPVLALEIAAPLSWYWWARGLAAEARGWLDRALAAAGPEPTPERGAGLLALAWLTWRGGADARPGYEESLAVYRALGDEPGVRAARSGLCRAALARRDLATALRLAEEGLDRAGDRRAEARVDLGLVLRCLGRPEPAAEAFTGALEEFRERTDRRGAAGALASLGFVDRQTGRPAAARLRYRESLALYRDLDLPDGMLDAVDGFACLAAEAGQPAEALRLLEITGRERRRLGAVPLVPDELAAREAAEAAARAAAVPGEGSAAGPLLAAVDALLLAT
ncbi:MAG: ATP-binding protein [Labedaea sp.]